MLRHEPAERPNAPCRNGVTNCPEKIPRDGSGLETIPVLLSSDIWVWLFVPTNDEYLHQSSFCCVCVVCIVPVVFISPVDTRRPYLCYCDTTLLFTADMYLVCVTFVCVYVIHSFNLTCPCVYFLRTYEYSTGALTRRAPPET